jgi:hypothetical protein
VHGADVGGPVRAQDEPRGADDLGRQVDAVQVHVYIMAAAKASSRVPP